MPAASPQPFGVLANLTRELKFIGALYLFNDPMEAKPFKNSPEFATRKGGTPDVSRGSAFFVKKWQ